MFSTKSLTGFHIEATDGRIGRVEQIYFDDATWTVRYLIVNTGGWLLRNEVLLSPISVRSVDPDSQLIRVSLTREQVEKSPDMDTQKPVSRQLEIEYYRYWGWPYYWTGDSIWGPTPFPTSVPGTLPSEAPDSDLPQAPGTDLQQDTHLRSSEATLGYAVEATDARFGEVEDLLIDPRTWEIRYLVIDTKKWWPSKSVVLSPEWVESISWLDRKFRIALPSVAIKAAPEFDPTLPIDRDYEKMLHTHYGKKGYWQKEAA